ncbi:MAG: DUF427 domain-containing protein [Myxococcota bacterium]
MVTPEQRKWRELARSRPARIETPGPGQESVWDYPRPPRIEPVVPAIRVEFAGRVVAESTRALRLVETSSPPAYYIPAADVARGFLHEIDETTLCEWKGTAQTWSIEIARRIAHAAAWSYPNPEPGFESIADHFAFNAGRVDACYVGEQPVVPQPGEYYGGWITPEIVGPFKGEPGSETW